MSLREFACACQSQLYQQLSLPIHEERGSFYSHTGVPHSLLNGVIRCKTSDAEIEAVAHKVREYFKQLGLPYSWWVEASETPKKLKDVLRGQDLNFLGDFPVMVMDLRHPFKAQASEVKVDVIDHGEMLSTYGKILGQAFQISQEALTIFLRLMQPTSHRGNFTNVLASLDGKGVATGSVTCTEEGAYICNDATIDETRKFGYRQSVTYRLLEIAKSQGCQRVAVIAAPSDAEDYKQLGFVQEAVYQIYA